MSSQVTDSSVADIDLESIFKDALKEEGLDAEVVVYSDTSTHKDIIRVTKTVNGKNVHSEQHIDPVELSNTDSPEQLIAHFAATVRRNFEEYLTEEVSWDDKLVRFDMKSEYQAKCLRCGAEVSISDLTGGNGDGAEFSVPNPPVNPAKEILPPAKVQFALHAMLRNECEPGCPNSLDESRYINYDRKI